MVAPAKYRRGGLLLHAGRLPRGIKTAKTLQRERSQLPAC